MSTVGIIANPASGKDIRRLVAYGTVFDNQEKVNIVRRILLGLSAAGVERAVYMPDYYGIVPKAVEGLRSDHRLSMEITPVDIKLTGTQIDSYNASVGIKNAGAGCIVTLGGDGTNRMAAKGCDDVPLLPVSTGTNNVFPKMVEGTIAGLAAGYVACNKACGYKAVRQNKKIVIYKNGQAVDIALIDAVVLKNNFIGSRAMWEAENLLLAVVTRGEAHNIGIASIAGNLAPVGASEEKGLVIEFDSSKKDIFVAIAPGLIVPVGVKYYKFINIGESVKVMNCPSIIALDGEREVEIKEGDEVLIRLVSNGPRVVDVNEALRIAVENGCSRCQKE